MKFKSKIKLRLCILPPNFSSKDIITCSTSTQKDNLEYAFCYELCTIALALFEGRVGTSHFLRREGTTYLQSQQIYPFYLKVYHLHCTSAAVGFCSLQVQYMYQVQAWQNVGLDAEAWGWTHGPTRHRTKSLGAIAILVAQDTVDARSQA